MKSRPIETDQPIFATHNNDRRDDARGGSFLLAHQQLGTLSLATNPTNGQTATVVVNGTSIVATFVTAIGTTPNNILIAGSAAGTVNNFVNWLRRPDLTNANQVAASWANQQLLSYAGYALPGSGTTIVPFSLNKNVNGISGGLTSFNITTTVTSGSWTAQTMQLYVEDGTYYIGNTRVLFTGGSTPTFTAPSSHPRIDLVTADSAGTIALVTGTEASSPSVPSYPANKAVLCEVYHVVGETGIFDNENQQSGQGYVLNDVRSVLAPPYISDPSQIANGTITAANLNASLGLIPSGSITMWGTTTAPTGWLLCDGSAISRTTYSVLFGIIGTTFGSGNGSTTFNLPNLQGNVAVGYKSGDANFGSIGATGGEVTHQLTTTEMPSHSHSYQVDGSGGSPAAGAGGTSGSIGVATSSAGGDGAHNNLQPFITLTYIIKQ